MSELPINRDGYAAIRETEPGAVVVPPAAYVVEGVLVNAPVDEVRLSGSDFMGMDMAIQVIQSHGGRVKRAIIEDCYIKDVFKMHLTGNAHRDRVQGIYGENIETLIIKRCFIDGVGYGDPSIFSHCLYATHGIGEVLIEDTVFRNGSSHGINVNSANCKRVICQGNAINFGVKAPIGIWANNYSITPHETPLADMDDEPDVPRGWHDYPESPLGDRITRLEADPIDWNAVDKADRGEWYNVAASYLKTEPAPPPTPDATPTVKIDHNQTASIKDRTWLGSTDKNGAIVAGSGGGVSIRDVSARNVPRLLLVYPSANHGDFDGLTLDGATVVTNTGTDRNEAVCWHANGEGLGLFNQETRNVHVLDWKTEPFSIWQFRTVDRVLMTDWVVDSPTAGRISVEKNANIRGVRIRGGQWKTKRIDWVFRMYDFNADQIQDIEVPELWRHRLLVVHGDARRDYGEFYTVEEMAEAAEELSRKGWPKKG